MDAMRQTEARGWVVHNSSRTWLRALRLAAVALGIGVVMTAGIARAQDAEEDDSTFEEKIMKGIMTGLGGTNMENRGIDYRERSPLVVPPKIDLPPPERATTEVSAPNWPKDPEVQARKAAAAARKNSRPEEALESARTLTPAEMAGPRGKSAAGADTNRPGDPEKNIMMSPKQLGVDGNSIFKNMFGGSDAVETTPFKGEPPRESLTQPPVGYQTPSPGYAYGTGPKEALKNSADINPMTGKY
jgi:hypothetical protein